MKIPIVGPPGGGRRGGSGGPGGPPVRRRGGGRGPLLRNKPLVLFFLNALYIPVPALTNVGTAAIKSLAKLPKLKPPVRRRRLERRRRYLGISLF